MGKPAGRIELAWLHTRTAAPWEAIFFVAFIVAILGYVVAAALGIAPTPTGTDSIEDCVRFRGGCA